MSRIAFFCIPAHGHTNPTLPVVKALTDQGHEVAYFSFEPFRARIEAAGARFIPCDGYDIRMDASGAAVATDIAASTELIVKATLSMEADVLKQLEALKPDVVVADSVAFWGKLFAGKLGIPCVCSTTTFAFNRYSSRIMKQGLGDLIKLMIKLPRTKRMLKPLRDRGYAAENILSIVQNDNDTDTVVYTSPEFQPNADTFSDRYTFVGPCIRESGAAVEKGDRPLVYVSMGTVMEGEEDFCRRCVDALAGRYDVILSMGSQAAVDALGALPEGVRACPSVDQIAVLKSADAFITHCGMNSVSEALWFGVPPVMRPLTPEEGGVAFRVAELGAGVRLEREDAASIRAAVDRALSDEGIHRGVKAISDSFHRCGGAKAAAEAIVRRGIRQ